MDTQRDTVYKNQDPDSFCPTGHPAEYQDPPGPDNKSFRSRQRQGPALEALALYPDSPFHAPMDFLHSGGPDCC